RSSRHHLRSSQSRPAEPRRLPREFRKWTAAAPARSPLESTHWCTDTESAVFGGAGPESPRRLRVALASTFSSLALGLYGSAPVFAHQSSYPRPSAVLAKAVPATRA